MKQNGLLLVLVGTLLALTLLNQHSLSVLTERTLLSEPVEIDDMQQGVTFGPVNVPCEHVPGGFIPVQVTKADPEEAAECFEQALIAAEALCVRLGQRR